MPLAGILRQQFRKETLGSDRLYTRLGVRWYAQGCFAKEAVSGQGIAANHLFRVHSGDFVYNRLFAWKGSFAVVGQEHQSCLVSNEFPVFEVDRSYVEPDYLWRYFSLPSVWRVAENISAGSTRTSRLRFQENDFLRLEVPLPPLPEQRAIVAVLRAVQQAKEACEQVITATRTVKQGLQHHLFTHGPVPFDQVANVALKETEIGTVPGHWLIGRLGDYATVGNGSTPKRGEARYWDNGTIPWLTSAKVHDGIITRADEFVTQIARAECHLPLVPRGSIVVAITGQGKTLGNSAKLGIDASISQHLAYISFHNGKLVPDFALVFLRSRYEQLRAISRAGGSTKGALTCAFLKRLEIPLPPQDEQLAITAQLCATDAKLAAEEARRRAVDKLFRSLLHNLMTGRLRVNHLAEQLDPEATR